MHVLGAVKTVNLQCTRCTSIVVKSSAFLHCFLFFPSI